MGFFGDVFGGLGRIATGALSGLGGGPLGAIAGAAGGLLGGGGLGSTAMGALGGLLGGQNGMDPAMAALAGNMLSEQAAMRNAIQEQMQYRNQMAERGLGLAEQAYAARAPMREMGMGALGNYFSQNPAGMFAATDPGNPGSLEARAPTGSWRGPTDFRGMTDLAPSGMGANPGLGQAALGLQGQAGNPEGTAKALNDVVAHITPQPLTGLDQTRQRLQQRIDKGDRPTGFLGTVATGLGL